MENKIRYPEIDQYIQTVIKHETGVLKDMEQYAHFKHVPIVPSETAAFLKVLTMLHKPARILEAGTAIGYSAIIMAQANGDAVIDTIEIDEDMAKLAKDNIKRMSYENQIRVIVGDALEIMQCLTSTFDMIFLDAAKGQYSEYLSESIRLLRSGGLLISDNVLYKGIVAQKGMVPHKHRTIAVKLREYLNSLCNDNRFYTTIVPIGDGMAVSIKKGDINEES